jgi:hypothetical protein
VSQDTFTFAVGQTKRFFIALDFSSFEFWGEFETHRQEKIIQVFAAFYTL